MEKYCKVLIVEDELLLRQGMKHMMNWEEEGFTVVGEAANGREAIEFLEKSHIHIIILDIVMPVMDGVELSKYVQETYPDIQIIVLSSYDKFEYVKATLVSGAVDYILKPTLNIEQLLQALKRAVERIPGFKLSSNAHTNIIQRFERYLLRYQSELEEADIQELMKLFPHANFQVLGLNLRKTCKNRKEVNKVKLEVDSYFKVRDIKSFSITLKEELLLVVLNYRVGQDKSVERQIFLMAESIRRMEIPVHFIISKKFTRIQDITSVYNEEFRDAAASIFYMKGEVVKKAGTAEAKKRTKPRFEYERYSEELDQRQFITAFERVREHLLAVMDCQIAEEKLKNTAKNLLYHMIIKMESIQIDIENIHQDFMKKIDNVKYAEDFKTVLPAIEKEILQILEKDSYTEDFRLQKILEYINKHYSEPLDLTEISKVFRFNYFYLSSYFNRQLKEGFSDYLNRIRIREACRFLAQCDMSIAEVSVHVGYSDQSYFSRVFKKITGMTPSTYRNVKGGKGKI